MFDGVFKWLPTELNAVFFARTTELKKEKKGASHAYKTINAFSFGPSK